MHLREESFRHFSFTWDSAHRVLPSAATDEDCTEDMVSRDESLHLPD